MFGDQYQKGKVLIFCPDIKANLKSLDTSINDLVNKIGTFIKSYKDIGIVLLVENEDELEFSKLVHLNSELSPNLRIVNTNGGDFIPILNSLGSIDAVLSLANFLNEESINNLNFPALDLSSEFSLSSSVMRPLVAPSWIRKYIGVFPNHFPLKNLVLLPENLNSLKDDLIEESCDAIVRYFSVASAIRERYAYKVVVKHMELK